MWYYLQDQALGAACEQLITRNQAFIPAFVRLIFHDCVSGCDGCIDTTLTESTHGDVVSAGMVIKNTLKQMPYQIQGILWGGALFYWWIRVQ